MTAERRNVEFVRKLRKKGVLPSKHHDCQCNRQKSLKAMEPDVAVSLAKQLPECGISIWAFSADDNAATIKQIREEVDDDIDKWADVSHTKKNFRSKLDDTKQELRMSRSLHILQNVLMFYVCCEEKQKPT